MIISTQMLLAVIVHTLKLCVFHKSGCWCLFSIKCRVPAELMPIVIVQCTYIRELSGVNFGIVFLSLEVGGGRNCVTAKVARKTTEFRRCCMLRGIMYRAWRNVPLVANCSWVFPKPQSKLYKKVACITWLQNSTETCSWCHTCKCDVIRNWQKLQFS